MKTVVPKEWDFCNRLDEAQVKKYSYSSKTLHVGERNRLTS
jgi:hypothetical protein